VPCVSRTGYVVPGVGGGWQAPDTNERTEGNLMVTVEKVTLDGGELVCVCGNTPRSSGWEPVVLREVGAIRELIVVEPDDERWDGLLYGCLECGRVVDQNTLVVVAGGDRA